MSDKVTIAALQQMKRDGRKIAGVVAWDTPMARIADMAGVDLVSVGDSVGVNLWGHDDPLQVTMDEMLTVCKAVRRGTVRALVSCAVPYDAVRTVVRAGIPVFAQFGLTPQTAAKFGIPYSAQSSKEAQATAEAAARLVEEARLLQD